MVWDFLKTRPSDERHESSPVAGSSVHVALEREDRPKFKCIYTAALPRGCKLKVALYTSYGGSRYDMSEITQANGKWVLFDVKAPADKILDRELLPDVEALCREILRLDRELLASDPSEFTDERGQTWRRVG